MAKRLILHDYRVAIHIKIVTIQNAFDLLERKMHRGRAGVEVRVTQDAATEFTQVNEHF